LREVAEGIIDWTNAVLSDQVRADFMRAGPDQTLDDDGDYFTWTLEEVRAAPAPEEARVIEIIYDVGSTRRDAPQQAKNVLWIAKGPGEAAATLGMDEMSVRPDLRERGKLLAARTARPTPFVDTTHYVSWNAMFVSAYLDAAGVLGGERERLAVFCAQTLDRYACGSLERCAGLPVRQAGLRIASEARVSMVAR